MRATKWVPALARVVVPLLSAATVCWAVPPGSDLAREALRVCREADAKEGAEQEELLNRGVMLAEAASDADDEDAAAQFALFCNLAKQIRREGVSPFSVRDLGRARRTLERSLELAPHDPDLLAAKGALLLSLPRLLGGDPHEAQQLLIQAFVADPDNAAARYYLERALK